MGVYQHHEFTPKSPSTLFMKIPLPRCELRVTTCRGRDHITRESDLVQCEALRSADVQT